MKKEGIFYTLWILLPKKQKVILVFLNFKMFGAAASDFSHLRQPLLIIGLHFLSDLYRPPNSQYSHTGCNNPAACCGTLFKGCRRNR